MSRPRQSRYQRQRNLATAFSLLALIVLLLAEGTARVAADDPREPVRARSPEEIALIVRARRPNPETTAEMRRRSSELDSVFDFAMRNLEGVEQLNVLENMLAVGTVPHVDRAMFEAIFGADVLFEGVVSRVWPAGTDRRAMDVDLRRVLRGSITVTPGNSPLRLLVGVDIALEKPSFEKTFVGHLVFVRANLAAAAETTDEHSAEGGSSFEKVYDNDVWPSTGREVDLFRKMGPLFARDATALLRAMRSKDETEQWLGCARAASTCAQVGGVFQAAVDGPLSRDRMLEQRDALAAALEPLSGQLVWDKKTTSFVRK